MKSWITPSITQYGRIEQITLGTGGSLPDLDSNLNVVNNTCPTQTFLDNGTVASRTACVNSTVS